MVNDLGVMRNEDRLLNALVSSPTGFKLNDSNPGRTFFNSEGSDTMAPWCS
jgi:hypothetical protein